MLSKEEIEKARENITKYLNDIWFGTLYSREENDRDEKILLEYIEQLESDNYELNNRINDYIEERRELIEKLEENNKEDTESVKRYEEMRRHCQANSFYKKSYQIQIHKLNAKREVRKEILSLLKGEKE